MTAHEFYLATVPMRDAIERAKHKGWVPLWLPHFGDNLLYHPGKKHGINIRPAAHGRFTIEKVD